MSVNHYLLPITDLELTTLLQTPEQIHTLTEEHRCDIQPLDTDGVAIASLTAKNDNDPLSFLLTGGPQNQSGFVGKYLEKSGRVIECEVDMGYGPASYFRNPFLIQLARALAAVTPELFAENCDVDLLEQNHIYPSGWRDPSRKQSLIDSFTRYRTCLLTAAQSGNHLLIWSA